MSDILLPKGWVQAPIAQLISIDGLISDGDWVESKDQDINGFVRLIQLADIGDGYFQNKSNRFMSIEKAKALNCTFLKQGDLLIARMPAPLGRTCIFPEIGQKSVTVVDICIIRTSNNSAITNSVLTYWLNSPFMRNEIEVNSSGTTRKRITRKKLEQFVIPLPPMSEQKIIAEKLDLLLAQVQETKSRLEQIPELLKQFRQSVLSDAVSGKLTEDCTYHSRSNNIILGNVLELAYGKSLPAKSRSGDGYPVYGSNGEIGKHKQKLVNGPFIIVGRKGSYGEITWSDSSGWPIDTTYYVVLKIKSNLKFIFYLLQTLGLNQLNRSTAIPGLNREDAYKLKINLPSIQEQNEIVRRVEQLFAYADKIEQQVNTALEKVNHLPQSILAKAFRGELTAQWRAKNPDLITGENSAASLLEKIQIERAQHNKKKK
ncbi:restriction endonuclease subunit S [Gilliamella sp. B3464]|uniref:restriction endonuclease subunit S n=1 Tax=unclassified Gilliamella TaxID=2685620 RepID=UPI00226A2BCB|nr:MULTISPECIES: restriction endonuclease subunit S [unclassified Gilliamella]MCX8713019.1 restriction endonuclease subunit S [Gilliamella sp. B3468]MCX8752069.1 restriction endonuclease subunit S [Gilliamella sp. B3464]